MTTSTPYDRVFVGGTVVTPHALVRADLGVRDGRIVAWENGMDTTGAEIVDCSGLMVLPGAVDMHFHCRAPGRTEREDFDSATAAAAHGGVTTLAEMPIARPSPHDAATFRARVAHASSLAVVDFAFYGAGASPSPQAAAALAAEGAVGFKIFLHAAPAGREDEFRNLCVTNSGELLRSLEANAATGLVTCVHAEDDGLIRTLKQQFAATGRNDPGVLPAAHPPESEELAVYTVGMAAKLAGARTHICHVSSLEAARAVAFLRQNGVPLTAETCPHYLLMGPDDIFAHGSLAKVNPPVRGAAHNAALRHALHEGTLDAVASDHAPFLKHEKDTDLLAAPGGMPCIEFFGPMMWDGIARGLWRWEQVTQWTAETPARLLGLFPRKGNLAIGADADIVLVDPQGDYDITPASLFSKSRESAAPLAGRYHARTVATYVRGNKVYDGAGTITAEKGYGVFLRNPAARG